MRSIQDAVLQDLLKQHPLPVRIKTGVRSGRSTDNIMWTVKFRNG